jgi:hypothetical protein
MACGPLDRNITPTTQTDLATHLAALYSIVADTVTVYSICVFSYHGRRPRIQAVVYAGAF